MNDVAISREVRKFPIVPVLGAIILLLLLLMLGMFASQITVSGGSVTPSGANLSVTAGLGGFGVGENAGRTRVSIGGHVIEFFATRIVMDSAEVAAIDDTIKQFHLTSEWKGLELLADGVPIDLPK
jgi:hypothetical protein